MIDTFSCHIPLAQKNAVIIDVEIFFELPPKDDPEIAQ